MSTLVRKPAQSPVNRFLTVFLWGLLAIAIVPTACLSMLYMLVIVMFFGDSGQLSKIGILSIAAIPWLAAVVSVGLGWLSIKMWSMPRWRTLSFPIAVALDIAAVLAAMKFMPGIAH